MVGARRHGHQGVRGDSGVTVAFAWYWPNHQVFVFPLPDPIPAKWLVTFLVAFDLALAWAGALTHGGVSDKLAHLAHLGGVGTALLFLKGQDWRAARLEGTRRPADQDRHGAVRAAGEAGRPR
jgi:hypothetical protein